MISAKLIKDLEKKGFRLDFPSYDSNEEEILDILGTNNQRLYLAIPLLLKEKFDYKKIINKLNLEKRKDFNKIIIITSRIFRAESIDNNYIPNIIKKNHIKEKINENEFQYYYDSFKDSVRNIKEGSEEILKEQIRIRGKLNTNKALSNMFSPGKLRIMNKIFNHEPLTNTELKYYYKSIRPLILSILNENLQKYIRIVESTRKLKL